MSVNQSQKAAWEEGIAIGLLRELGDPAPPISVFELASACGLEIVHGRRLRTARLVGTTIELNTKLTIQRQHEYVAHELGHWALERAGELQSEWAATYVGDALMLPRSALREPWDAAQMRAISPYASARVIARRLKALIASCGASRA